MSSVAVSRAGGPRRADRSRWARNLAINVVPPLVLLGLWELVTRLFPSFYFPPPSEILLNALHIWSGPAFLEDAVPSVARLMIGWLLAVVTGVTMGFALGLSPVARDYVQPITEFLRNLPPVALIPVFLLFFGIGDTMKVLFIAGTVIWVIVINSADGATSTDATQRSTARIYGIGRGLYLRQVIIPAALPKIFAGLTISLPIAIILMVVSEMVAATNGVGFLVLESQRKFRILDMWSGIVLLSLLGFLLSKMLQFVEKRVLRWHHGAKGRA